MKLITVDCNSCGAPLEVGQKTRFVTCRYCSKRLEIQHSESSVYTEVLDEIRESTDKISQDMEVIKKQNQLEKLDREWMLEREGFMISSKDGGKHLPEGGLSSMAPVFTVVFGIIWIGFAASMGAPGFFVLFGVVFVGAAIFQGINMAGKARGYQEAQRRYQVHRSRLQMQLRNEEKR